METLPKPTFSVTAKEIFEICISGFSDKLLQIDLLACSTYVEKDSLTFCGSIPELLHTIQKNPVLPKGITKDHMIKVYSDKFAKKNTPGRIYYDKLLSAPQGGRCPICGVRLVKNLDHYLPKAFYPTLVVTPENLIPTCRDCNFDKHAYTISKPEEAPLHPYFDDISDEIWLVVNLMPHKTALYDVECPETWTEINKMRIKRHLQLYNLDEFYASKSAQEIADNIFYWQQIFSDCGEVQLLDHLIGSCASIEKNQLNSWRAALYRGLVNQFDELKKWLT